MRRICYLLALPCLFALACKEKTPPPAKAPAQQAPPQKAPEKKVPAKTAPAASPVKWPAPARKDGKPFAALKLAPKLEVGAKVELWWRATRSKNAFADHGPYTLGGTITAAKAPWGAEGGLSGAAIMAAVREATKEAQIRELRLRGVSAGVAGPDFKRGMITVEGDAGSFFNKAVGRTAKGVHQIFVDVDLKDK